MLQLAIESLKNPKVAIVTVLATRVSMTDLVKSAVLVACVSGILDVISRQFLPSAEGGGAVGFNPIMLAVLQFVGICVIGGLTYQLGRMAGGTGSLEDAFKVSVWFSAIWLLTIVLVIGVLVVAPPIFPLVQIGIMFWSLYVFTCFVQVLHGFRSFFATFGGVFFAGLFLGVVVLMLMGSMGLLPTVEVQ